MDEIFMLLVDSSRAQIVHRCSDKKCISLHPFSVVTDENVGKVMVDALNASSYAAVISSKLSEE